MIQIKTIDGVLLRDMFVTGAAMLEKNREAVDALNVFPVPDGDTGTNMSLTMNSAVREVSQNEYLSAGDAAAAVAKGALRGARGNSGVITSQLYRGFARALEGVERVTPVQFAAALKRGAETAYKAVMKPKEGTILTVARVIAEEAVKTVNDKNESCWQLKNITSYDINNDGIFKFINKIDSINILEGKPSENAYTIMVNSTKRDRDIDNKDLKHYVDLLEEENLDEEYRLMFNKYLQRFFHPFVCVLLAIMGCLLGFSKPREQKLIGFTIAIGCIFVYYITLPFFDLLAEKGILHPFICAAFPPVAFLGAILAFYKSKDL